MQKINLRNLLLNKVTAGIVALLLAALLIWLVWVPKEAPRVAASISTSEARADSLQRPQRTHDLAEWTVFDWQHTSIPGGDTIHVFFVLIPQKLREGGAAQAAIVVNPPADYKTLTVQQPPASDQAILGLETESNTLSRFLAAGLIAMSTPSVTFKGGGRVISVRLKMTHEPLIIGGVSVYPFTELIAVEPGETSLSDWGVVRDGLKERLHILRTRSRHGLR